MKTIQPLSSHSDDNSQQLQVPPTNTPQDYETSSQEAAAKIMRDQLDRLYKTNPPNQLKAPAQQPATEQRTSLPDDSSYRRTHQQNSLQNTAQSDSWKQYHSAWQNYYQQYYQRYYMQQLLKEKEALQNTAPYSEDKKHPSAKRSNSEAKSYNPKEATKQIHDEIIERIQKQATRVRHSVHFMPIITALVIGLLFLFIQYNRVLVAQVSAYVSPGSGASQSIIIDPTTNTKVGPEPRVIIPKINVDAPVVYGVGSLRENDIQTALRSGVVHYPYPGANALPGQVGNSVLLGHTSNDVFDSGNYKFVFVLMERLQKGDTIYVNYKGTRYTYIVTKKEVVNPTEINKIVVDTDKPLVTLIGCVPVGTADQRLLVTAEQISPDPTKASSSSDSPSNQRQLKEPENLPGDYSETLFERLF